MAHADSTVLQALQPVLRQLREIKGVREVRPGIFHIRGSAFAHFHNDNGVLYADLKMPGGSGFDRYPLDTAPHQRKFIEEARLRAGRLDDE
jgi:hypothetical protein